MLGLLNLYKYHKTSLLFILVSSIFYVIFAYDLIRTNFPKLILLYVTLFLFAFIIIKATGFYFRLLVFSALLFRILFLFAIPNLSQDFYRFIWDGRMILEGFSPYLFTPESFISIQEFPVAQAQELYRGMGVLNGSHFSNYPPLNQLCFVITALFGGKSIVLSTIVLRVLIISADFGILFFGIKILDLLKLPRTRIFWYLLNPFIIIELTGNLHFEGVMLFFLVWSLYLLFIEKWKWAALVFGLSVSLKLIPLLFLPLFLGWFVHKSGTILKKALQNLCVFYGIVIGTVLLSFLPFTSSELLTNYSKTIGLWFNDFEFNASLYYVLREIGYLITGYNQINTLGIILPIITFCSVLYLSFFRKNNNITSLLTSMLFAFTIYLICSTTVHPWYVATLVILSVFINFKYPLLWSLTIVLSYMAYANTNDRENLWIVALEYTLVIGYFIWEIYSKSNTYYPDSRFNQRISK